MLLLQTTAIIMVVGAAVNQVFQSLFSARCELISLKLHS